MNEYQVMVLLRTQRQAAERKLAHSLLVEAALGDEKAQPFRLRFNLSRWLPRFGRLHLRLREPVAPPCADTALNAR